MPGTHLEITCHGEEKYEHRHRVVPDIGAVGIRCVDRCDIRAADGDRHRHVHARATRAQAADCAGEKRACGIEHDRGRDEERNQTQETLHVRVDALEFAGVERDSEHHDLHHSQRRDQQALERRALFGAFRPLGGIGCQRLRFVAEVGKRRQYSAETDGRRIPGDAQAMRNRVDVGAGDARELAESSVYQPAAGGAVHAADIDRGFGTGAVPGRESGKHVLAVEHLPFAGVLGRAHRARMGYFPRIVIALEAGVAYQRGDRLAAGAADGMLFAADFYPDVTVRRDRQRAVKTRLSPGHRPSRRRARDATPRRRSSCR